MSNSGRQAPDPGADGQRDATGAVGPAELHDKGEIHTLVQRVHADLPWQG